MEKVDHMQEGRGNISRERANLRTNKERNARYQKHYKIIEVCLLCAHW